VKSIKYITFVDENTNPKSVLRLYFILMTLLTWEQQARLTHPNQTIADVTDKWSFTSTALYLLVFLILSPFLFNRLVADAPVDCDKCA
jgi:hypothetical protein